MKSFPTIKLPLFVGTRLFPPDFRKSLSECLTKFREDYETEQITWIDSNGNEITSSIAYVKGSDFTLFSLVQIYFYTFRHRGSCVKDH